MVTSNVLYQDNTKDIIKKDDKNVVPTYIITIIKDVIKNYFKNDNIINDIILLLCQNILSEKMANISFLIIS